MKIVPSGPNATLLELDSPLGTDTSATIGAMVRHMAQVQPPGLHDVVAGFTTVLLEHRAGLATDDLIHLAREAAQAQPSVDVVRHHVIPVVYGAGVDVPEIEAHAGLPFDDVVRMHAEHVATVAFVGFTPGFPYMLGLPDALHLPRRTTPVLRIEPGTVAIADGRTGIYPSASPGGWWALGRTPVRTFDPYADPPALFSAGDTVTFAPAAAAPVPTAGGPTEDGPTKGGATEGARASNDAGTASCAATPAIEVVDAVPGSASLQGRSRPWGGRFGVASGGVLDRTSWETMRSRLDMGGDATVIESLGQPLTLRALRTVTAVVAGGGVRVRVGTEERPLWRPFVWPADEEVHLVPTSSVPGRVAMVGIEGGFAAGVWLGSTSTDVRARAGGTGRWLARGDRLGSAASHRVREATSAGDDARTRPTFPSTLHLRLHPGPQFERRAWDALLRGRFRTAAFDRTGVRLAGAHVAMERHEVVSEGVPLGAVQVPPDGGPIVLLADRGRTGGYAKPAVVDVRDLGRLAQATPSTEIRFVAHPSSGRGRG